LSATLTRLAEITAAFRQPANGVAGVIDELIRLCQDQGLRLQWCAGQCRIETLDDESAAPLSFPLPKPVFRAILARLAALCNAAVPDSVSPYGGQGELVLGGDSPFVLNIQFTNTPEVQELELSPADGPAKRESRSLPTTMRQ
jgi:hypothetical protein